MKVEDLGIFFFYICSFWSCFGSKQNEKKAQQKRRRLQGWEVCLCQRVWMLDVRFFLPSLNWPLITNLTVQSRTLVLTLTVSLMREKSDKQSRFTPSHTHTAAGRLDRDGEERRPSAASCLYITVSVSRVFKTSASELQRCISSMLALVCEGQIFVPSHARASVHTGWTKPTLNAGLHHQLGAQVIGPRRPASLAPPPSLSRKRVKALAPTSEESCFLSLSTETADRTLNLFPSSKNISTERSKCSFSKII